MYADDINSIPHLEKVILLPRCKNILRTLRSHNIMKANITTLLIPTLLHYFTTLLMNAYSIYIRPILESASMVYNVYLLRDKKVFESYFTRRLYIARCHKAKLQFFREANTKPQNRNHATFVITSLERG